MDPITTTMFAQGIAKGVGGLFKTGYGLWQRNQGKQRREELMGQIPDYDVPESMEQLENLYGNYLSEIERQGTRMPGQDLAEQKMREYAQSQIRNVRQTARTSTQAMGGTTDVISQTMENLQALEIQGMQEMAKRKLNAMGMYGEALGQIAPYEEREWQYEEFMPWKTKVAQAQQEYISGSRAMESGFSDIFSGGATAAMTGSGMFGGGNTESGEYNPSATNYEDRYTNRGYEPL